jgi:hypothetical protein
VVHLVGTIKEAAEAEALRQTFIRRCGNKS